MYYYGRCCTTGDCPSLRYKDIRAVAFSAIRNAHVCDQRGFVMNSPELITLLWRIVARTTKTWWSLKIEGRRSTILPRREFIHILYEQQQALVNLDAIPSRSLMQEAHTKYLRNAVNRLIGIEWNV